MPHEHVSIEVDGDIAILRLSRPPANAINIALCETMAARFDEAVAARPAALVVTGTDQFFSGGLDLKEVPTYTPDRQRSMLHAINRMVAALYTCPRPVVGAINGHAIAGGFILALTPDYRVGPAGAFKFGLTEARVGIPFPAGPMIVLRAELAPPDGRYITLHARNFGPDEALRRGVFDELQPSEAVLGRAIEVARDLAMAPRDAYAAIKRQVRAEAYTQLEALVSGTTRDPMLDAWVNADAPDASARVLEGGGS